ncbi:MAG: DnaT-like ssDNA-binding protein [Verrucomicrobiota bacterium]
MALTLTKEDGTGKADANAYADVADGDAYFEGHLYATLWTAATADQKAAALVMATRLIDAEMQFYGLKAVSGQALQWPRLNCPDPDGDAESLGVVKNSVVPPPVICATCEMAQELMLVDRTAAPPGEGILTQHNTDYSERRIPRRTRARCFRGSPRPCWRSLVIRLARVRAW